MLSTSAQIKPSILFELKEHPSGCQCPGYCKGGAGDYSPSAGSEGASSIDENKQSESGQKDIDSSNRQNALSSGERQEIMQLQQRDNEVRSHEAAHIAAGGSAISGSANFTYQKGPDGKLYAIGGEVPISISGGNTPEETIAIARQVQAGAMAPANPSPQDLKVAASAAMMEARARQELSVQNSEELKAKAINTYKENQEDNSEQGLRP